MDIRSRKISETFKGKHIDNFRSWRTKAKESGKIPDSEKILSKNGDLAFLIGLILGDGCLSKFERTECLRLTLGTDKPKLAYYAVEVVASVFSKRPSIIKRSNSNCFNITLYQKNISARLGLPCGARENKAINFPNWIWEKNENLINFLRGLFEAEASYSVHIPTCTYNFEFSNTNESILDVVESILWGLG